MSIWELRQVMESAVPWWVPVAVAAVLATAYCVVDALRKRR
jgi:hypothetical protein